MGMIIGRRRHLVGSAKIAHSLLRGAHGVADLGRDAFLDWIVAVLFSKKQQEHHCARWRALSEIEQEALESRMIILGTLLNDGSYKPDLQTMRRMVLGKQ